MRFYLYMICNAKCAPSEEFAIGNLIRFPFCCQGYRRKCSKSGVKEKRMSESGLSET